MARVLEEYEHVATDFSADPVHDLRVTLRRCRSLADGLIATDPDRNWKAMKKSGKQLFQRLGALRDVQIMMEWIDKLHPAAAETVTAGAELTGEFPSVREAAAGTRVETLRHTLTPALAPTVAPHPAPALRQILRTREAEQKREARAALEEFDRKQWKQWSKSLPLRAARVRPGSAVFKHLALERWTSARELHTVALRNRSQVAFHTLRIGIKRFRYIVENFLPAEHKAWGGDLKHMQDLTCCGGRHRRPIFFPTKPRGKAGTRRLWRNAAGELRNIAKPRWGNIPCGTCGARDCRRVSKLQRWPRSA